MITALKRLVQFHRRTMLRIRGVRLGMDSLLGRSIRCRPGWADGKSGQIISGEKLQLEDGVILDAWGGTIRLGTHVFIGPYTVIYGHGGVEVGDQTLISMHCRILSSNHSIPPFGTDIRSQPDELRPTKIGRDVWLGAGVTVLGGVTIGDGCIVGAGAVVTQNIPAGAIAYGVPATVKSRRSGIT